MGAGIAKRQSTSVLVLGHDLKSTPSELSQCDRKVPRLPRNRWIAYNLFLGDNLRLFNNRITKVKRTTITFIKQNELLTNRAHDSVCVVACFQLTFFHYSFV
jgi:hypothetical protein